MQQRNIIAIIFLISIIFICFNVTLYAQNVIIVVVDGARYTETFGSADPSQNIPHLWNDLKPEGTLYINFRIANEGHPITNPGHAAITTGTWQNISNIGGEYPHKPTIFEYFRKELGASETDNFMIGGKSKLEYIKHSDFPGYDSTYQATWSGNNDHIDSSVYNLLVSAMDSSHPRLILANFPETDLRGHAGNWDNYLAAIVNADSLIYQLWTKIQTDDFYKDNTTLFITNDHGRHDSTSGGFQNHGDDCDGCEHIMCFVLGRYVSPNQVINIPTYQIDIAPTVGTLLGFTTPFANGQNLYGIDPPLPVELISFSGSVAGAAIKLNWRSETEVDNFGFEIERSNEYNGWVKIGSVKGHGNSNSPKYYNFTDADIGETGTFYYRLKQIDNDGTYAYSNVVSVEVGVPNNFHLSQNYPNPFNPLTKIRYKISELSFVTIKVYNVLGNEITTLVSEQKPAGSYEVTFDVSSIDGGLPSGIYIYRLHTPTFTVIKKMTLLK
jgi:hypothetical protein